MAKELKDYLHLYLGCRIRSKGGKFGELVSVSTDGTSIVVYDKDKVEDPRGICIYSDWLLILLRPLSDMTEEERFLAQFNAGCFFLEDHHPINTQIPTIEQAAIVVNKLRKIGFDCDGLIPAGLAIDKTKIK